MEERLSTSQKCWTDCLRRIEEGFYRLLVVMVSLFVAVLLILVGAQIASREFRIGWLAPPDEIITLFFTWLVFIGTAILQRDNKHLRVEVLDPFLLRHLKARAGLEIFLGLLVLVFTVVMFYSGLTLYRLGAIKVSPILGWSERIWYLPLPVSAALLFFYTLVRLVRIGRNGLR